MKSSIQNHDKFCVVPFVKIVQDTKGTVRPCHWHEELKGDYDSLSDAFLGDEMESIREDMRKGIKREECRKCHDCEDNNIESHRTTSNYIHRHIVENIDYYDYKNLSIRDIELGFDNVCNFKCVSCSPSNSSPWEIEVKKFQDISPRNYFDELNFSGSMTLDKTMNSLTSRVIRDLEMIVLVGGEPMLNKKYPFELFYENFNFKNAIVVLFTNNSLSPKGNWHKFFRMTEKPCIFLSIDGIGEVGEWIRTGFKQNIWEKNLLKWIKLVGNKEKYNVYKRFYTGISSYFIHHNFNIFDLKPTIDYLNKFNVELLYESLYEPKHLCPSYLPDVIKETIWRKIDFYDKYHEDFIEGIFNFDSYNRKYCIDFINFFDYLCLTRKAPVPDNCRFVYDELKKWIEK